MPFADLTDARCHYELVGTGDPLLLVPGLGMTCNSWDWAVSELSNSFTLILADKRDVGQSTSKRTPQTLVDFAVDLVELLDYLQLDRTHVMGLSLGGIIAQRLAMDHPSRIDRLVLISCTNRFGPYLREIAKLLGQAVYRFPPALFRRTMELLGSSPQYLDTHLEEMERKVAESAELDVAPAAVIRELRCLARHDVAIDPNERITAPTLVIAGEHDMLIPACYAQQMARDIMGSEFMLIPACGHNPLVEQPQAAMPRIREFLMRSKHPMNQTKERHQLVTEELV